MNPGIIKLAAAAVFVLLTLHGPVRGESNEALVQRGNAAYGQGNFDEALALYDEASVTAPESPQIHFNRGTVHYQKENYTEAIDAFKVAALRSKDLALSAQAKFNLGNCAFRNAQRQRDSDLAKAIEHCEESISYYQEAHGMDSESTRAAENIEIVRLYVKVLLDEQKKQQEEQEKQEEQENELVKKLKELIARQNALIEQNEGLRQVRPDATKPDAVEPWMNALRKVQEGESQLHDDTGKVLVEMRETIEQIRQQAAAGSAAPGAPPPPAQAAPPDATGFAEKVEVASGHVGNAMIDEQLARDELAATRQEPALAHQANAVKDLEEAVKALSEDQEQQQQSGDQEQNEDQEQQDQKEQEQEEGEQEQKPEDGEEQDGEQEQEPQDGEQEQDPQDEEPEQRAAESAEDILDEEKENQRERQPARPGRSRPVDKDW